MACDGERVGAGEPRRPGADDGDALAGRRAARVKGCLPVAICASTAKRCNWPILTGLPSAASRTQASSQSFSVGQTRAHMPPMMLDSRMVSAAPSGLLGRDLANEQGNVDRGRAGLLARRVVAEIAALGLDARLVRAERRVQVGEIGLQVWRRPIAQGECPTRRTAWRRASSHDP